MKDREINFETLNESHFSLIHQWFNKPHVQGFYSLRNWKKEDVSKKLMPYIKGEKGISGFIVSLGKMPIGYIQSCPIKDHPWDNQDLPDDVVQEAAGFDIFIGEEEYLGKNLGSRIVETFLEKHIWPHYRYCLADPDIRNEASMRLFVKCGFKEHKQIASKDALQRPVTLQLFIKERI